MDASHPDPFHGLADTYASHRPGYPKAAIAFAIGDHQRGRILDLGCGTGISTRLVSQAVRGHVTGADPSSDMLTEARSATPSPSRIDYVAAAAESLPFTDRSVDLVLCAQAFHWFDRERALPEICRVLRPNGNLALVWNVRDPTADAFARAYDDIVARAQEARRAAGFKTPDARSASTLDPWLEVVAVERFHNSQVMTEAELIGRAQSASYFPREDPLRAELVAGLHQAFARHRNGDSVTLAQHTEVTLAMVTTADK